MAEQNPENNSSELQPTVAGGEADPYNGMVQLAFRAMDVLPIDNSERPQPIWKDIDASNPAKGQYRELLVSPDIDNGVSNNMSITHYKTPRQSYLWFSLDELADYGESYITNDYRLYLGDVENPRNQIVSQTRHFKSKDPTIESDGLELLWRQAFNEQDIKAVEKIIQVAEVQLKGQKLSGEA